MDEVVVLTGFMGVGKSATGRVLAELLGWDFVDLDEAVEARARKSVAAIFAQDGEERFRRLESDLLGELLLRNRLVLAAGGGLLLLPHNRELLQKALVVNLDAPPAECLRRVGKSRTVRPLLQGPSPADRVEELYAARRPLYEAVPNRVDTLGKSPREVAREIARRFLGREEGA